MLTKIPHFYCPGVFSHPSIYNTSVQELVKPITRRQPSFIPEAYLIPQSHFTREVADGLPMGYGNPWWSLRPFGHQQVYEAAPNTSYRSNWSWEVLSCLYSLFYGLAIAVREVSVVSSSLH